ncbi:MAG TPA: DUF4446 family protein [Clostridiales bacterium]|nr:DUF4446 family protein [Clostridiales bacterium]
MNIMELINNNLSYIILCLIPFSIILFILIIILIVKQSNLKRKYKKFMTGSDGGSLENQILLRFEEIDQLIQGEKRLNGEINAIRENLMITYQKIGIVKYDAFKEMGGKLSFVLALLNKENNGIILNSVHSSREGCYIYLKEIINGESFLELSEDEKNALNQAINSNKY